MSTSSLHRAHNDHSPIRTSIYSTNFANYYEPVLFKGLGKPQPTDWGFSSPKEGESSSGMLLKIFLRRCRSVLSTGYLTVSWSLGLLGSRLSELTQTEDTQTNREQKPTKPLLNELPLLENLKRTRKEKKLLRKRS